LLLVSKKPLDVHTIFLAYANSNPEVLKARHLLYPALENNENNIINSIVESGWRTVADTSRIDLSPCTDDRPFIAQMGLLRNIDPTKLQKIPLFEVTGFPLS
jgi:hypothetical protein